MGSVPSFGEIRSVEGRVGHDGDWRRDRHVGTDADDAPLGSLVSLRRVG
jgi:hypothetical protein